MKGLTYRHYSVMQAGWNTVHPVHVFFVEGAECSPDTCAAGVATQRTDVPALVIAAAKKKWSHDAIVSNS